STSFVWNLHATTPFLSKRSRLSSNQQVYRKV
ncbi:MAG: hypothetical protein ACI94D_002773, partial [Neolewinella sp.]